MIDNVGFLAPKVNEIWNCRQDATFLQSSEASKDDAPYDFRHASTGAQLEATTSASRMSSIHINRWDQRECSSCRALKSVFEQERRHARESRGQPFLSTVRTLHSGYRELDTCALDGGCVACQVFRRALLSQSLTNAAYEELTTTPTCEPVRVVLRRTDKSRWLEVALEGVLRATVALSQSNSLRRYPIVHSLDPLNAPRVARLRTWISSCHQDHLCANYRYSQRNPTWLIRILGDRRIHLVSGHSLGSSDKVLVRYVALSYCWGDEQSITLSSPEAWQRVMSGHTVNVKERQQPFSLSDLPETLQDAITITHHLGIEYIWIDSVCVPKGSWNLEAGRMHEVYGNAAFTLSSSSTTAATDRMLTPQDAWRDVSRGCRLHDPWLLNTDVPLDDMRLRSPVTARGWIMQEERLSPRILYWCAQRAYWSCVGCQRIESKQAGGVWPQSPTITLSHPQKFMRVCRDGDPNLLGREWCDIVSSYARRSLSATNIGMNRFAAFSGLAVRYLGAVDTTAEREEYLAGLWRRTLPQTIAWGVRQGAAPEASLQDCIPSWSWLSLPLRVDMEMQAEMELSPFFRLRTKSMVTSDESDEDVVSKGAGVRSLELSGRLRPLLLDTNTAKVPWDGVERPQGGFDFSLDPTQSVYARHSTGKILLYEAAKQEVLGQLDYVVADDSTKHTVTTVEVKEGNERNLQCFEVGAQAMLLLEAVTNENDMSVRYRRVGIISRYRKNFFEGATSTDLELV